ncbi:death-associated protein kinase 1-like [Branchiostoma floridae]|uniref:Death-associated protein kinase 1-like n=1 Tax=Branchiostoma floridae TaxID=7739 RepID=A0A9J7MAX7_BRAFL|nr:death-associated protein kinase 1-like [Branchiostoma floridae]
MEKNFFKASREGDVSGLRSFKKGGGDINIKEKGSMRSALHYAASRGKLPALEWLVAKRADVNAKDALRRTPLHEAAAKGRVKISQILITKGAEVNVKDFAAHETPLHSAAGQGRNGVVELLLAKGGAVNATDEEHQTPLHRSALGGHVRAAQILLSNGSNINIKDKAENAPLHCAAAGDHIEAVKLLLSQGADVFARNKENLSPLDVAGSQSVRKLIRARQKQIDRQIMQHDLLSKDGGVKVNKIKLLVCGDEATGKSTLIGSLCRTGIKAVFTREKHKQTDTEVRSPTAGVDVGNMTVPNAGEFAIFDFAGQAEYYVTHAMLMHAKLGVYVTVYNITDDAETQTQQLQRWLRMIKAGNADPSVSPKVVLVGSHGDKIDKQKGMSRAAALLRSMRGQFRHQLDISTETFVLDCVVSQSPDMDRLRKHLACLKQEVLKDQPQLPKLCSEIVRKVPGWCKNNLGGGAPVLRWPEYVQAVKEIDPLVKEDFLLKSTEYLNDIAEILLVKTTSSDPIVVLTPPWLCGYVFGPLLAPENFPIDHIERESDDHVTFREISRVFSRTVSPKILVSILREFQICHTFDGQDFIFPSLLRRLPPLKEIWKPTKSEPVVYFGSQVACKDATDSFSPDFFPRLQTDLLKEHPGTFPVKPAIWKDGMIFTDGKSEGLIAMSQGNMACNIVVRNPSGYREYCYYLLERIQRKLSKVLEESSPGTSVVERVLSSRALREHRDTFYSYDRKAVQESARENGSLSHPDLQWSERVYDLVVSQEGPNKHTFQLVAKQLRSTEWRELGRELGLSDSKLDRVQKDYSGDLRETVYRMLTMWEEEADCSCSVGREKLSKALVTVNRRDIADELMCDESEADPELVQPDTLQKVAESLQLQDCRRLGRALGLTDAQLDGIEHRYPHNLAEQQYQILVAWRQQAGSAAYRDSLASALKDIGRLDVAEEIQEEE